MFKRFEFYFNCKNYLDLKKIKNSFPSWTSIEFNWLRTSEDLEVVTNPVLYQNGVRLFKFDFNNYLIDLSDKFISNILEIKPKSVWLKSNKFEYKTKFNFIDVLSKFPKEMKLTFGNGQWDKPILLRFSNTVFWIFDEDKKKQMFFKWKSFLFQINQENIKDIRIEHHDSDSDLVRLVLHLNNYDKIEIENFEQILIENTITKIDPFIPDSISKLMSNWKIKIFPKDLSEIKLHNSIASLVDQDGVVILLISKLSQSKSFWYELVLPRDIKYLFEMTVLFPLNKWEIARIYLNDKIP